MNIQISDPLELLPYQTSIAGSPKVENAAKGTQQLNEAQKAIVLGEPVPIVFCRRIDGIGGVFVSPKASEANFADGSGAVVPGDPAIYLYIDVKWRLVLSEGNLPTLMLKDMFHGACRIGTWKQAYNEKAATWNPGNTTTFTKLWQPPVYCGSQGRYTNLTVLSFENRFIAPIPDGAWNRQVHVFVRNGIQVTRILDNTYGSSNNFVDLALYLLTQSNRLPSSLIDTSGMMAAAKFLDTNQLYCNGVFDESKNLEEWLYETSAYFLLRVTERQGKKSFRPTLPFNSTTGSIVVSTATWVFGFTEEHILPDGFEISYIPLSERKSVCVQVLWRQQPDDDIGIIRTTEVRFDNEATDGPYEQYDLSRFCASENHAVKVGVYYAARRKYITHALRIQVRPSSYNSTLALGDIVRVKLKKETISGIIDTHDYLYEVERINRFSTGVVELDLMHYPLDDQGRSIVALYVNDAVGAGYTLTTSRADFTCDVGGRRTSADVITQEGGGVPPELPPESNFEEIITPSYNPPTNNGATNDGIEGEINNPIDPFDEPVGNGITGDPVAGLTLETQPVCADAQINWYRIPKNANTWDAATGQILDYSAKVLTKTENVVGGNPGSLVLTTDDVDYIIYAEWRCPDPASPDGYGTPVPAGNTTPVEPDLSLYQYIRLVGTYTNPFQSQPFTTQWVNYAGATDGTGTAVNGMRVGNTIINPGNEDYRNYYSIPAYSVPWRASLAITQFNIVMPSSLSIGLVFGWTGFFSPSVANSPGGVSAINARWQFSNDQSTVLLTWGGR
jgi:hypothetical protein